jgi:hypothetical protein
VIALPGLLCLGHLATPEVPQEQRVFQRFNGCLLNALETAPGRDVNHVRTRRHGLAALVLSYSSDRFESGMMHCLYVTLSEVVRSSWIPFQRGPPPRSNFRHCTPQRVCYREIEKSVPHRERPEGGMEVRLAPSTFDNLVQQDLCRGLGYVWQV